MNQNMNLGSMSDKEGFHVPNWFKMLLLLIALTVTYPLNVVRSDGSILSFFTYLAFSTIALSTFGFYLKLSKYLEQQKELSKRIEEVLRNR